MNDMDDYYNIYIERDVLLLVDVFVKVIGTFLEYFGIDRCHYILYSSPGLCWDSMLKTTEIELEPFSDIGIYLFVEKGMRGGLSYIAKQFIKSSNKYMML